MIVTRRWVILFLIGLVPASLTGYGALILGITITWYIALVLAAFLDWRTIGPTPPVTLRREAVPRLCVGAQTTITLRISNQSKRPVTMTVVDTLPDALRPVDARLEPHSPNTVDFNVTVNPHERKLISYDAVSNKRGDDRFGDVYVHFHGKGGLVRTIRRISATQPVKIYPEISRAGQFDLMARKGKLRQVGLRKTRTQGMGREFESLRDYLPDDELRRIDWKATARKGKLVSRQYEVERSQAVIIALDLGRTMLSEVDGVAKIDHAINASLLLTYVAQLADDMVGLLLFSDQVHCFLPPRRGHLQVHAIAEHLYNAWPSLAEADYQAAFAYLQSHWRKRALVVCFTDLWDPDSSRQTVQELSRLQPRHLVAAVTLMDSAVLKVAQDDAGDVETVYHKAIAQQVIDDRKLAQASLAARGVVVVDSPAEVLSLALVNRYLEIKDRMLI